MPELVCPSPREPPRTPRQTGVDPTIESGDPIRIRKRPVSRSSLARRAAFGRGALRRSSERLSARWVLRTRHRLRQPEMPVEPARTSLVAVPNSAVVEKANEGSALKTQGKSPLPSSVHRHKRARGGRRHLQGRGHALVPRGRPVGTARKADAGACPWSASRRQCTAEGQARRRYRPAAEAPESSVFARLGLSTSPVSVIAATGDASRPWETGGIAIGAPGDFRFSDTGQALVPMQGCPGQFQPRVMAEAADAASAASVFSKKAASTLSLAGGAHVSDPPDPGAGCQAPVVNCRERLRSGSVRRGLPSGRGGQSSIPGRPSPGRPG